MLRFLSDENFNGDVVRGLWLREPNLNLVRVQDVNLEGRDDPEVLLQAADDDRIILTHDRSTLPDFAFVRVVDGEPMPGVFVVNDRLPVRQVIDELLLINACSEQHEWSGRVLYLPL
jgi:predicted nuclease of predicted toxin-antitoxin system